MKRHSIAQSPDWQSQVEPLGFNFEFEQHAFETKAYYSLSTQQAQAIQSASSTLWEMCQKAVQHVIDHKLYAQFGIPNFFIPQIERSWKNQSPELYTGFNLVCQDGQIKLLSIDTDVPNYLFEAAVLQKCWLEAFDPQAKQCNQYHNFLVDAWYKMTEKRKPGAVHFSCFSQNPQDFVPLAYLRDCAIQAEIDTHWVALEEIGWAADEKRFVDADNEFINNILKIYPYHYLVQDEFAHYIVKDKNESCWIEPAWKMLLANKAILCILWQLYPEHPYLLCTDLKKQSLQNFAQKPLHSCYGEHILLSQNQQVLASSTDAQNPQTSVYQALCPLPEFDGRYLLLSSAIIGKQSAGFAFCESDSLISGPMLRVVPHKIEQI